MGMLDDAVPGGNISKPLMIVLGALLVGKLFGSGKNEKEPATPLEPQTDESGGILGGLGGLLGKLADAGQGDVADSWVKPGQNKPISPGNLGNALGSTTLSDLARASGMSEQELLQQLSVILPGVVDRLTPQGQIPSREQIMALLRT